MTIRDGKHKIQNLKFKQFPQFQHVLSLLFPHVSSEMPSSGRRYLRTACICRQFCSSVHLFTAQPLISSHIPTVHCHMSLSCTVLHWKHRYANGAFSRAPPTPLCGRPPTLLIHPTPHHRHMFPLPSNFPSPLVLFSNFQPIYRHSASLSRYATH